MSKCAHGNTLESSLLLFYCLRCTCSCLTCMHACVMYTEVGNGEDSTTYHVKHCALIHSVLIHIINEATKKNKGQPAHTHNQQLGREERGKRKEERGKRKEERGKNLVDGAHDGSTVPGVAEVQEARVVLVQEDAELGEALGRSKMHGRFALPARFKV